MEIPGTLPNNTRFGDYKMKSIQDIKKKIMHAISRFVLKLITTPPIKLENLVRAEINPIAKDGVSGVYGIPRKAENIYLKYIGMTFRKLKARIAHLKYTLTTTVLLTLIY